MASYKTKLKVARKLEDVDNDTASDNRISALFRFDEEDESEEHVSISIESDAMGPEDVWAVFQLLHDRGVLTAQQTKTWLHQSKASRERFGKDETWQGEDLTEKVSMMKRGLTVRGGGSGGSGPDAQARNKQALLQLRDLEEAVGDVKATLQGADEDDADGDEADGPTPPDAL